MSPLAQALSAALIHFVWQGALVGVLLWAALAALRNRSADVRYLVSCGALAVLVVVPVVTAAAFILRAVPVDVRAVPMVTNLRTLIAPQPMLSIWMNPEASSAPGSPRCSCGRCRSGRSACCCSRCGSPGAARTRSRSGGAAIPLTSRSWRSSAPSAAAWGSAARFACGCRH